MSRITRRAARLLTIALPLAATAAGLLPAAGNAAAYYNVGVKSLHFQGVADACLPDQALPCTPGAGEGESNVLRVLQTEVDGYYQFTTVEGTSQVADDHMWLAAEIGAECRAAHHLTEAEVDNQLTLPNGDGWLGFGDGLLPLEVSSWAHQVPVPDAGDMPTKLLALHLPVGAAFGAGAVDYFSSTQEVLASGEAEIQRRIEGGMSPAEARGIPYELNTAVTLAASVACEYDAWPHSSYYKRALASIPLRIEYVPVDVPAPVGDLPPAVDDVIDQARVTDAELVVLPDAADPCTLHLSGVISTNRETDVEYRFVNPYGQPSNTYTLHVDRTQVAMVDRTVEVPHADVVDVDGDFAPTPGQGEIGGYATEGSDQYTGTYELEIISPNHLVAADGFSVGYCEDGDPTFDPPADDVVAEPDATHSDPIVPSTTTLPAAVATPTTLPPAPPTIPAAPTTPTTSPVVIGVLVAPATTGG